MSRLGALAGFLAFALGCDEPPAPVVQDPKAEATDQVDPASEPAPREAREVAPNRDPIEAVHDCATLTARARRSVDDRRLLPILCPGLALDHEGVRTLTLSLASASAAARAIPTLDAHPDLQGLVRLAALDRSGQPMPSELPDPATARLIPIDDRTLAGVELAYAMLREPGLDEDRRIRAHALLARIYIQAIESLELPAGRPLPPFARLLAGPALFHGRNFCRFHGPQRTTGLERVFAQTEVDLLALLIDLDNTAHAADPGLLALERQRTRAYLLRSGPSSRIAKRARQRPEARALGTELLLPIAHELGRLLDHGLVELAVDEGLRAGAEAGYGIDPIIALLTEDLRERDLREYESRLARRIERARKANPGARLEGRRALGPELPVEWPSPATVAERARAWLSVAHGRGPDFARRHALGRALLLSSDRPDAVLELLAAPPEDAVVHEHDPLLLALLDAFEDQSLAALRVRVSAASHDDDDTRVRRSHALAARDALVHPR